MLILVLFQCPRHAQCTSACHINVCNAESYFSTTQGNSDRSQKSAVFGSKPDQGYTSYGQPSHTRTAIHIYYHVCCFYTCKHNGSCMLAGDLHASLLLSVLCTSSQHHRGVHTTHQILTNTADNVHHTPSTIIWDPNLAACTTVPQPGPLPARVPALPCQHRILQAAVHRAHQL
jgi:hypothetical protein